MKLYYYPGVCSLSVHVALHELGLEHELEQINIFNGDNRKEEYLKINPRGQVAALETDEGIITENAAILIYLNDKHDGNLFPQSGYDRAMALQWLMYANSGLHGAYSKAMFLKKNSCPDEKVKEAAFQNVQDHWDEIERHLNEAGSDFMVGDKMTAADIYIAVVAAWAFLGKPLNFGDKTRAMVERVVASESFQKSIDAEGVDYKLAG